MIISAYKNTLRSFGARLFSAALLLCIPVLSAFAQTVTEKEVKYTINYGSKTAKVSGTTNKYIKNVVIADAVTEEGETFPVVSIADGAFSGCTSISSLHIGSNVTSIASKAFYGCQALERLYIPEGVETLGAGAFQNCSLHYVEIPSTVKSLGNMLFRTNERAVLDTLVLNSAFYDADGNVCGLPYNGSAFNGDVFSNCVLMVPNKAYDWYCKTSIGGAASWGNVFTKIVPFGTEPLSFEVTPSGTLDDYRDLSEVQVELLFADKRLTDNIALGDDGVVNAYIELNNGAQLHAEASEITLNNNHIIINFERLLRENKDVFVARSEAETHTKVRLFLSGDILVEGCPFSLTQYFKGSRIEWIVPLLPSVIQLPEAPAIQLDGEADPDSGLYSYNAFQQVVINFPSLRGVSLNPATGAFISALLSKDGHVISAVTSDNCTAIGNNILMTFSVPKDEVLVRHSDGVSSFDFSLTIEGQVAASDGNNYRFTVPFTPNEADPHWSVSPEYIPEPTDVICSPADGVVSLADLSNVCLTFDGVSEVYISRSDNALSAKAELCMDGQVVATLDSRNMRCEGNVVRLPFAQLDERLVTLITANADAAYSFSVNFIADILTDGYPCRIVVGNPASSAGDATTGDAVYTTRWTAPSWSVPAVVCPLPTFTVSTPLAEQPTTYEDLKQIVVTIDNYKSVSLPASADEGTSNLVARLLRYGNPVCVVSEATTEDNRITIDFGDALTFSAVGITPDDDPNEPVELTFSFSADLLFDGLPYRLTIGRNDAGTTWSLEPIVVYKLPTPAISFADNRLYFTCGVEGVTYHYSIINLDEVDEVTEKGRKTATGSTLTVPLKRLYEVTVYATREGYEDSEVNTSYLLLDAQPQIEVK